VFLFCLCKDQNVVQVHYYYPFGYEGSEDVVHHSLEGSRTVGYSKEHHKRFEETSVSAESCLPFISRPDAYIIETPADIKFYEVLGSTKLGNKFKNKGKRISVLDSYGVQYAVVLD